MMDPQGWQQQQQQQQQFQRQREQQMKAAHWQQQDKKKQQSQPHRSHPDRNFQAASEHQPLGSEYPGDDPFTQIEFAILQLRQDVAAGILTEAEANARLSELYVQDEQGYYWTVAINSGEWRYFDGHRWIAKCPPGHSAIAPLSPSWIPSDQPPISSQKHPFLAFLTFIFGGVLTASMGYFSASYVYSLTSNSGLALWVAIAIWVWGCVLTIKQTQYIYRGIPSRS
ncbi:MAG: hypothetical protein MUF49_16755 [Oculatellaceae cyanobacterium Prado106]|jgi:hypothetical protein|nr:hypothetical protein [Oculatellaceae cyanobacterium Prado106]